jgi:hypothetical protein
MSKEIQEQVGKKDES